MRSATAMRYLSICSGIGSDAVAWHPLGWECAAFAEVDPHANAVLAHRFPDIPNAGDFTRIQGDEYGSIDLVAGGTPCQSFSVAGLRKGMDDDRGNLALEFCRLVARTRPRWVVWENVPGVLSIDGGRAFGSILRALVEFGYGCFWTVHDAQYVRVESHPRAVPQRRRRVFLVGYLGDWRPSCAVLLERESMRGDTAPRRKAGKSVAGTLASRTGASGGLGTDFECSGGLVAWGGGNTAGSIDVATCQTSHGTRLDFDSETFIAFSCKDYGADAGEVSPTLRAMPHDKSHANGGGQVAVATFHENQSSSLVESEVSRALRSGASHSYQFICKYEDYTSVRRLTPREAERLQGLPDDWTQVPYGKRNRPMKDGPRYRLVGNGISINCLRWLGERIQMFEDLGR